MHGFDPAQCLIVIEPNTEEDKKSACIPPDSIIDAIKEHETSISMIMMSGVHYYSGQVFDMKAITALAHQYVRSLEQRGVCASSDSQLRFGIFRE